MSKDYASLLAAWTFGMIFGAAAAFISADNRVIRECAQLGATLMSNITVKCEIVKESK